MNDAVASGSQEEQMITDEEQASPEPPPAAGEPAGTDLSAAARNGMIALLGSGVAAVAGLVLNVVIGRGFGTAGSGTFFVVVAVLTVLSTIGKLGADTGLVWSLSRVRTMGRLHDVRRIVWIALLPSLAAGVIFALALYLAAPWAAGILGGGQDLERLFRVSAPFLIIAGPCMVLAAGLRGTGDIIWYTGVQNVLVPGLRPIFAAATLAAGLGLSAAIVTWSFPFALGFGIAVALVIRRTARLTASRPATEPGRPQRELSREFWGFSAPRAVTAALEVAIAWADVLIVASLTTPREAGIYAAASRFILTGTLAEGAMRVAMAPEVNRLLTLGDMVNGARLCATVTQWTVLLAWPLYLVLGLYSPAILSVFGSGFSDGALALTILSVAMLMVMSAGNNQTVLLMSGRSGVQMVNRVVALTGNILMNVWMVPRWGMNGAALAWAITYVADAALVLVEVRLLVGLKMSWRRVWPAMALSGLAFGPIGIAVWLLTDQGAVISTVGALSSIVLFLVLVVVNRRYLDVEPVRQALPFGRRKVAA